MCLEAPQGITQRLITNSRAFGENSLLPYHQAVDEVRLLLPGRLYPPRMFPSIYHPQPESSILRERANIMHGLLTPPEAVAILFLLNECAGLMQGFAVNLETTLKLRDQLGLETDGWPSEAIEGMADFGRHLGYAAMIRELIQSGKGKPVEKDWGGLIKSKWWDTFMYDLIKDNLVLGQHTAEVAVSSIDSTTEINLTPFSRDPSPEIACRIRDTKKGVRLGKDLYLEVLTFAQQESFS
jgi:hypothetical protein